MVSKYLFLTSRSRKRARCVTTSEFSNNLLEIKVIGRWVGTRISKIPGLCCRAHGKDLLNCNVTRTAACTVVYTYTVLHVRETVELKTCPLVLGQPGQDVIIKK